jgi:hypothetical protein
MHVNDRSRRVSAPFAALLVMLLLAALAAVPSEVGAQEAEDTAPLDALMQVESVAVVEVLLDDPSDIEALEHSGVDVDMVLDDDAGLVAHAVVTPSEQSALEAAGFTLGATLYSEADWQDRLEEREALLAAGEAGLASGPAPATTDWMEAAGEAFAAPLALDTEPVDVTASGDGVSTLQTDDVMILRADYYEGRIGNSGLGQWVYVEAKTSDGQAQNFQLQVQRDSGPGTEIGSGGTQNLGRFTDAGQYMYHRGQSSVSLRPDYVRVTSPNGGIAVAKVRDWLPLPEDDDDDDAPFFVDFVDSYQTPTELYARIHELADAYPDIAEIIELPYKTNGYRRNAQLTHGSATSNAVVVSSHAWGHEGGNDITIDFVNPGASDQPLTVGVDGDAITVSLATSGTGGLTSTAAQVVAAINGDPGASALVLAHTYRGNSGNGTKQAGGPSQLSDFLDAPMDEVSRDPHPVYALRIGKHRDGSRMGVLAYAQEHAREWVPPIVALETAERLLHNYAEHGPTKQLVNNLDIFILPSVNPDGGHYSFYDSSGQRKNMTNHCPITGNADPGARNSWGVDNNRNYAAYTSHPEHGYSGGSSSCTSGTYRGPSILSEPESANVAWVAEEFGNIRFSMNLHASGDYFMWSPGAYSQPGRIAAPRPTLEEEDFFWTASERILTEIKKHRGNNVVPQRTGPIIDVLYSAAGNSGDHMWYLHDIYGWNFEVGRAGFQPNWTEAHDQMLEFSNGLMELFRVARDFDTDNTRPESTITPGEGTYAEPVVISFEVSEPAAIHYTLDGSRPTYDSPKLASTGVREPAETFTITETTTIHWFSVDEAGNVEKNYDPDSPAQNFNTATITID